MHPRPTQRLLTLIPLMAALSLSLAPRSSAEPITVAFSGNVLATSLTLPEELVGIISAGDPVVGSFTIDPSYGDHDPDPTIGVFRYEDARFGMRAQIGGAYIESSYGPLSSPNHRDLRVQVLDNHVLGIAPGGMDRFGVMSFENSALSPSNVRPAQFQIFLSDFTRAVFDSDAMPELPLDLSLFGSSDRHGEIATLTQQTPKVFIRFSINTMGLEKSFLPFSLDLDPRTINLRSHAPWLTAYIESEDFNVADVDPASLTLATSVAADPKWTSVGDHDEDGVADLMVKFSRESLGPHLSAGVQELTVVGSLVTGEEIRGSVEVRVIEPPIRDLQVSIAPNPLNPVGVLTLRTERPGPVTVRMFDVRGRLVRTLVEARSLPPGIHEVRIDGRGDRGQELTSGVYFYRAETVEGIAKGRVAILK